MAGLRVHIVLLLCIGLVKDPVFPREFTVPHTPLDYLDMGLHIDVQDLYQISQNAATVRRYFHIIAKLTAGAVFGDVALLHNIPRSATVTTNSHYFFKAIEGRNSIVQDASYSAHGTSDNINNKPKKQQEIIKWLKKLEGNVKQSKEKRGINELIAKLLAKKNMSANKYKILAFRRDDSINSFLKKLNSFIQRHTKNNVYEKPETCSFGFGNPGNRKCRKDNEQSQLGWSKSLLESMPDSTEDSRKQYRQHMLVERAYTSSESDSESDEEYKGKGKRSRFKIVNNNNANKKKRKRQESSESKSEEFESRETANSDYNDNVQKSGESTDSSSAEYHREHVKFDETGEESDEKRQNSGASNNANEKKYMYLQGTRLYRPNVIARRDINRLPGFMPKQYEWDSDMIHDLDSFWINGIKGKKRYNN